MEATRRFNRQQLLRGPHPHGQHLRPNEWFLLGKLRREDDGRGLKPSDLATLLQVTPASITQLITGLESRGLVHRSVDPEDRRAVRVSLTEKGRSDLELSRRALAQAYAGLVDALGMDDCRRLTGLLDRASAFFESQPNQNYRSQEEQTSC
jgi:DNA-binding MarR family transcriptional regulator